MACLFIYFIHVIFLWVIIYIVTQVQYREHTTSTITLYTSKCAFMRIEAKASTMYEPHSIVTSVTLAATARPEGRIIVGYAVYAQMCIPVQYAIIASTYCMQ